MIRELYDFEVTLADIEPDPKFECPSCEGLGYYTVGDPEDGVEDECCACLGTGQVEDPELDTFDPKRDAFQPGD